MNETIRIYGKILKTWRHEIEKNGRIIDEASQYEIEYTEYYVSGEIKCIGTEDFSRERYRELKYYEICVWDGIKLNKGGRRWFESKGFVRISKKTLKLAKKYFANKYNNFELVQLRAI